MNRSRALPLIAALILSAACKGKSAPEPVAPRADPAAVERFIADFTRLDSVDLVKAVELGEKYGKPISARLEAHTAGPALMVVVIREGAYVDYLVDRKTGAFGTPIPLDIGGRYAEQLADAKLQAAAMVKARISLRAAVGKAAAKHPDMRVLAAFPDPATSGPVAIIKLANAKASLTETVKLD